MTIEIAEDNHIALCTKIPKWELKMCEFVTFDEFRDVCESGMFQDHDCDAVFACEYNGDKYRFPNPVSSDCEELENLPQGATRVFWWSK